jgi:hypothetical protein
VSNVKPGDRAIIIKANHPENIGKLVLVVEPFNDDFDNGRVRYLRALFPSDKQLWIIESLGGPLRTDRVTSAFYPDGRIEVSTALVFSPICCVFDEQLRRLDDDIDTPE